MTTNTSIDVYIKKVSSKELEVTLLAHKVGICAEVINHIPLGDDEHLLHIKEYPKTLCEVYPRDIYARQVQLHISALHKLGYMHCDISCDNVVVDEGSRVCKLIDFGSSESIEEVQEALSQGVTYYTDIYSEGPNQTLEEAKAAELCAPTQSWFLNAPRMKCA